MFASSDLLTFRGDMVLMKSDSMELDAEGLNETKAAGNRFDTSLCLDGTRLLSFVANIRNWFWKMN